MPDSSSYISVQGQGTINVIPDVMRLEIEISDLFDSYDDAYSRGKENKRWVSRILESNKLSPSLGTTVDFDLQETKKRLADVQGSDRSEEENIAYSLHQKIRIDIPIDGTLASHIVREIGEKIPGVCISIGYTLRDLQQIQLKILEKAVSDAGIKAKVMAEAAGCSLGRVAKINYKLEKTSVYRHARTIHTNNEAKSSTPGGLDITPADFVISDTVEVTWNLK